jgi:hypothetical protein
MKRAIVLALSVILALVVAAPTVLAQDEGSPNGVPPGVVNFSFELPVQDDTDTHSLASFGCDFRTSFEVTGKTKTIEQPDGSWIVTSPGFYVTVENLVTHEALTFNATGSTHATPRLDGSGIVDYVITGRNVALDPFGVFLNEGRFTYSLRLDAPTPQGNVLEIVEPQQGKGQAIDVCALLS